MTKRLSRSGSNCFWRASALNTSAVPTLLTLDPTATLLGVNGLSDQHKPYAPRTIDSIDSQSVHTMSGGEKRSRDNAKNFDGRKRHLVVDSLGFLLAVLVTVAGVDDAMAARKLFPRLEGQPVRPVRRVFADGKAENCSDRISQNKNGLVWPEWASSRYLSALHKQSSGAIQTLRDAGRILL